MKIVCATSVYQGREAFSTLGDTLVLADHAINSNDVAGADALIVRSKTQVDGALLAGSAVRFVGTATAGNDHFDGAFLSRSGIAGVSAPGCNANSVAEYVITSLLCLAERKHLVLSEKTIGVIGVGSVGNLVAEKCRALGMNVMLNDPPLLDATRDPGYQPLEDLLQHADILTLHVPLTKTGHYPTHHLADCRFFAQSRPGLLFINASRGEVMDSEALLMALDSGLVGECVLDVWEEEPEISRFLLERAAIATPHIAGYSLDGRLRGTEMVFREVCNFFEQEAEWVSEPLPVPEPSVLELDARGLSDEEALWRIAGRAYDVVRDDTMLREAAAGGGTEPIGPAFNQLRTAYPTRREFAAHTVNLAHGTDSLLKKLQSLGFAVVLREDQTDR